MKYCLSILLLAWAFPSMQAGEIKLVPEGFLIDAGTAGIHTISYPRLLNPNDQGLKPENITVNPDGSGATMTYTPSGKLSIERQTDGVWFFQFREIPADRVKFAFSTPFPLEVLEQKALWSFDNKPFKPFPVAKGEALIHTANPANFVFKREDIGFAITYLKTTFTMLTDNRVYGKKSFVLGHLLYFPGKKHVPEINYSIKIELLSPDDAPARQTSTLPGESSPVRPFP